MTTTYVSALRWVPPFAQGLVRDLRVRWALEEACHLHEERLIGLEDQGSAAYRAPCSHWARFLPTRRTG
jgi:glutathione S-transferase